MLKEGRRGKGSLSPSPSSYEYVLICPVHLKKRLRGVFGHGAFCISSSPVYFVIPRAKSAGELSFVLA